MQKRYVLIFDDIMLEQLQQAGKNQHIRSLLSMMLDKLEELCPYAGKLLDPRLGIYEVKMKHPPLRLYYKHNKHTDELYVLEYETKTSPKQQKRTIQRLRKKALES